MKKSLQFLSLAAAALVVPSAAAPLTHPKPIPVSIQDPAQNPAQDPTQDPTETEELTATGNGASTLVYQQVDLNSRRENYPAKTATLVVAGFGTTVINLAIVPAADGTIATGQTYEVVPDTAEQGGPSVTPNSAEVQLDATPKKPFSRAMWKGAGGTVTILAFTRGSIGPGEPGAFKVRFNAVKMVASSSNPVKDPFILQGPLAANLGGTPIGRTSKGGKPKGRTPDR